MSTYCSTLSPFSRTCALFANLLSTAVPSVASVSGTRPHEPPADRAISPTVLTPSESTAIDTSEATMTAQLGTGRDASRAPHAPQSEPSRQAPPSSHALSLACTHESSHTDGCQPAASSSSRGCVTMGSSTLSASTSAEVSRKEAAERCPTDLVVGRVARLMSYISPIIESS